MYFAIMLRIITLVQVFVPVFIGVFHSSAQSLKEEDKQQILSVMDKQVECWNNADIACFMEGYWKSDSLKFIGKSGITYGWQNTLENYKKRYPDKAAMGVLTFELISIEALAKDAVLLIGKWRLKRETDEPGGHYSLIWKRIEGKWVIIADHSS